jgi:hypothetical protein
MQIIFMFPEVRYRRLGMRNFLVLVVLGKGGAKTHGRECLGVRVDVAQRGLE